MSKTLGNVIDPLDTIQKYGTDALRFTLSLGIAGQDLNLSTERLTSNKAFTNKLWNAGKFVLQNMPNRSDASAWEQLLSYKALPYRNEALIVSLWPQTSLPRDVKSIKRFENLQALTRAIRNARAEYYVEPAKRISASIVASTDVLDYICSEKQVLALLSRLDLQNVHFTETPPDYAKQAVHLVAGEGLEAYLPLADMVDVSAEVQRLSKRITKMQSEYDALVARLCSPTFVEKAPEEVVRGVREKATEAEERLKLTKNRLSLLESSVSV